MSENDRPGEKAATPNENTLNFPTSRRQISLTADRLISDWAVGLQLGTLELWQLPASLHELFVYAYEAGRSSVVCTSCERLRWELRMWYFVANNPGKRPSDYHTHATNALWAEASK